MFSYHNRVTIFLDLLDLPSQCFYGWCVQIGRRFIHYIDFRVYRLCRCNRNLLAHSIGQAVQAMIQNVLNLNVRRRPVNMVPNFLMGITVVFTAESNLTGNLIGKKLAPGVLEYIPYDIWLE